MNEIYQNSENLRINRFWTQADACASSVDMTGKVLINKEVKILANEQTVNFDISALSSGIYHISIVDQVTNNVVEDIKFTKN